MAGSVSQDRDQTKRFPQGNKHKSTSITTTPCRLTDAGGVNHTPPQPALAPAGKQVPQARQKPSPFTINLAIKLFVFNHNARVCGKTARRRCSRSTLQPVWLTQAARSERDLFCRRVNKSIHSKKRFVSSASLHALVTCSITPQAMIAH